MKRGREEIEEYLLQQKKQLKASYLPRGREMRYYSKSKWIEKKQICQLNDHKICIPSTSIKEPEIKSKPNEHMSFIHYTIL
jgi:hypothetical protein